MGTQGLTQCLAHGEKERRKEGRKGQREEGGEGRRGGGCGRGGRDGGGRKDRHLAEESKSIKRKVTKVHAKPTDPYPAVLKH